VIWRQRKAATASCSPGLEGLGRLSFKAEDRLVPAIVFAVFGLGWTPGRSAIRSPRLDSGWALISARVANPGVHHVPAALLGVFLHEFGPAEPR